MFTWQPDVSCPKPVVWSMVGPVPAVPVDPCWASQVYATSRRLRVGLSTYRLQRSPLSKVQRVLTHFPSSEPS